LKVLNFDIAIRSDKIFENNISKIKTFGYRQYLKQFKFLMPVGHQSSLFFENIIPKNKKKIHLFPYCVDTEWIYNNSMLFNKEKALILKSLGFSIDDLVIVSAIKFNDREDPLTLIKSFLRLRKANKKYKLILIGDGPLKVEIENIIFKLNDEENRSIYLPGYVNYSSLIKYFSISNLFIHPAFYEPFGVSVQEALICGIYVITSDQVGSRFDFIKKNFNGDIFIAGNEIDLYNKIKLWEDKFTKRILISKSEIISSGKIYNYNKTITNFKTIF